MRPSSYSWAQYGKGSRENKSASVWMEIVMATVDTDVVAQHILSDTSASILDATIRLNGAFVPKAIKFLISVTIM